MSGTPPDSRAALGLAGEIHAAHFLLQHGYIIIETRWRCRYGEIDAIAHESGDLVFIEVRTRRGPLDLAIASITPAKQTQLGKMAVHYLDANGLDDDGWRVDAVAVSYVRGRFEAAIIRDVLGW